MKFLLQLLVIIVIAISSQSCKNAAEIATDETGMIKTDIGEGKVIFMRDCRRCHEQKNIESFTTTQWSNILPRMIIQAQINDTESRQVTAYIEWKIENH